MFSRKIYAFGKPNDYEQVWASIDIAKTPTNASATTIVTSERRERSIGR
jgi:hypothetical protein